MYKTVGEFSVVIKTIIDTRWSLEASEEETYNLLVDTFSDIHNRELAFRGNSFSATFERKLGKKRIEFLKSILKQIDPEKYKF